MASKMQSEPDDAVAAKSADSLLPREDFWQRYNARQEFPISTAIAFLLHLLMLVIIIYGFFRLMNRGEDRSTVPTRVIDVLGGDDDFGEGMAGSGGTESPLMVENRNPLDAFKQVLPDPQALPEIKESLRREIAVSDPTSEPLAISDQNAVAFAMAEKTLRDKLLGVGGKPGAGPNPGSGDTGVSGTGEGRGADSTRARSFRWTLRFRTTSGRDYVNQVKALGAIIAFPIPPGEEKLLIIDDLSNPTQRHVASDEEISRLASWLKFSDVRPHTVQDVGQALRLDFTPRSFWAFFPKSLEEDLARKERSFRNRRPEDIDETIFQVTIREGGYNIVVVEQTAKR